MFVLTGLDWLLLGVAVFFSALAVSAFIFYLDRDSYK